MTAETRTGVARAEIVGSLLRPDYLKAARQAAREGRLDGAQLREVEDRAVIEAIALQERLGLDVISDGELRRAGWNSPLRTVLSGFSAMQGGSGYSWRTGDAEHAQVRDDRGGSWPFVTQRVKMQSDAAQAEYPFLKAHAHRRTKYTFPAPSYYRTHWHEQHSSAAYPTVEGFLAEIRDFTRRVVRDVAAMGCDYIQLDAPNYGRACDPDFQALMQSQGRTGAIADLQFDGELDNSVFDGVAGITRAMHICRGNGAGAWNAQGGYGAIAAPLFPLLSNVDVLLLEYDTPRAGDFSPLRELLPRQRAVLGLLTTKEGHLEDADTVAARIHEAQQFLPLARLAVSPQCGFASAEAGNPITAAEQEAKLRLVVQTARRVWGG
ncbi:MAG TPA: cobalamin-independent methionine synthase II family protein [Dehalococcoidia bacterium]|nr:cobalamin-independent methionine synthase II family protein [Dehalococcoidia bacterium]